jgi:two-component system, NarL family, response regulator DevR
MAEKTTVFIVDDHDVVRQGVRATLETTQEFEVVGEAATVHDAFAGILATAPRITLVDVRLSGGDGVELVREIRATNLTTKCLMLSSFADETAFFQAVVAGAVGYVLKTLPGCEIVEACRAVASGASLMTPEALDRLRDTVHELPNGDHLLSDLTAQERRILQLITEGLTNREIADDLTLAEKTVRNYVSNLLAKMGMKNRTQATAYVIRSVQRNSNRRLAGAGATES